MTQDIGISPRRRMSNLEADNSLSAATRAKVAAAITPERWAHLKKVLGAALERELNQRAAFLDDICGADESLRAEVESLLGAAEEAGWSTTASELHPRPSDLMIGCRLGDYEIVQQLGRGGMAEVYLAVRADAQYRKRVAIKALSMRLDNQELVRRFRNERQTLAALDHPNIVKLLDGGTTEQGWPYLVMDYVEGLPIDQYCDRQKQSTTERLRLFHTVCVAVQYAHENRVIHRDLKPSNILVAANGTVKLLDFGIAKVLNAELSAQTLLVTQTGSRHMTPAYASPEQVRGEKVTYSSDVYSLGVVLYELLTGHRPYRFKQHTFLEIERVICDIDPGRPSTAVSRVETVATPDGDMTIGPELVSQTREGDLGKLRRRLQGDLDTIVLMALHKEPQRRYASVKDFAEDIQRHLEQRPVKARRPTLAYRASKLVRRRRSEVLTGVLAALMLLAVVLLVLGMRWNSSLPVTPAPAAKMDSSARGATLEGSLIVEAIPWARVDRLVDAHGSVTEVNQQTPLRLGLPPGQYTVYLSGPNGQQRTEQVSVSAANPTSCRTTFEVVDVEKLLGAY
jgi:eukaryotic-like serine/threonine-protein kinase